MNAAARPVIGVTTSEIRRVGAKRPEGDPTPTEMALGLTYLRAIEAAEGLPLVMPPLDPAAVDPLLDQLAGICLSGGPDLDPESYGERERDPNLGPTERELDRFELAIASGAWDRDTPVLAICRGMQALNVARGGTLHQHLPDLELGVEHRQDERGAVPTHELRLDPDSRLAEVLGADRIATNSFHHQGIDRLGEGLVPVAWAADGTIEAYEDPAKPFLIGVQWHAELHRDREPEQRLFAEFIAASSAEDPGEGRATAGRRFSRTGQG
jgi:putative glutamine amidotransferase